MLEGMTNGFFVVRHLPGAVDLKSTPFPSKPGSKVTGFPFDLLPRSRALRSKSNATSFFPNGWTRRSLEMVYPRDDIADIFVYEGAAHHHSFGVRFEGRNWLSSRANYFEIKIIRTACWFLFFFYWFEKSFVKFKGKELIKLRVGYDVLTIKNWRKYACVRANLSSQTNVEQLRRSFIDSL